MSSTISYWAVTAGKRTLMSSIMANMTKLLIPCITSLVLHLQLQTIGVCVKIRNCKTTPSVRQRAKCLSLWKIKLNTKTRSCTIWIWNYLLLLQLLVYFILCNLYFTNVGIKWIIFSCSSNKTCMTAFWSWQHGSYLLTRMSGSLDGRNEHVKIKWYGCIMPW